MEKLKLTREQAMAVEARGNALLVSAAAGSGKTFVLVQRLLRQITDEEIHADITDSSHYNLYKSCGSRAQEQDIKGTQPQDSAGAGKPPSAPSGCFMS